MLQKPKGEKAGLIGAQACESHRVIAGPAAAGLVLLCDHARNWVPQEYEALGLPAAQFERHIAYDIGAEAVTLGLAKALNVPAILANFSRLLIDPNRGEDDPTLIMRLSDGAVVKGNARVDEAERCRRLERFYRPYHGAVAHTLDGMISSGLAPAILSVHSFTPAGKGAPRQFQAGVLSQSGERRFVAPLLAELGREDGMIVVENEPYRGGLAGDTLDRHGQARGLAHALLEIRQDLIADDRGVNDWIERLCAVLPGIVASAELHEIADYA